MLQDIEFVTFAKITQSARAVFKGAVALGGNGQFVRAQNPQNNRDAKRRVLAKRSVNRRPRPWNKNSLSRMGKLLPLNHGNLPAWRNNTISLVQAKNQMELGCPPMLAKIRPNLWGSKNKKISLTKKLDLIYYLSATLLPPIILLVWMLSIAALIGLFKVYHTLSNLLPDS